MRVLLVLTVALLLAVSTVGPASTAPAAKPTLRLVAKSPAKLRGTGFKARERVRVTLVVDETSRVRTVRATTAGAFTATFEGMAATDPCSAIGARAVGSRGSRAALKLPQRMCPMPLGPATR